MASPPRLALFLTLLVVVMLMISFFSISETKCNVSKLETVFCKLGYYSCAKLVVVVAFCLLEHQRSSITYRL